MTGNTKLSPKVRSPSSTRSCLDTTFRRASARPPQPLGLISMQILEGSRCLASLSSSGKLLLCVVHSIWAYSHRICHPSRPDLAINLVSRHLHPHLDMAARSDENSTRQHDLDTSYPSFSEGPAGEGQCGRAVAVKPGRTNSSYQGSVFHTNQDMDSPVLIVNYSCCGLI